MIHREFAGRRHILVVFIAVGRDTAHRMMLGRDVPTYHDEVFMRSPIVFKIRRGVAYLSNP